jgi:hypothetical protein
VFIHHPDQAADHRPPVIIDQPDRGVVTGLEEIIAIPPGQDLQGANRNNFFQPAFLSHGGDDFHLQALLQETPGQGPKPDQINAGGGGQGIFMKNQTDSHDINSLAKNLLELNVWINLEMI